jgi:SM-20-related protein
MVLDQTLQHHIDGIIHGIETQGYAIRDAFLPPQVTSDLFHEAQSLKDTQAMRLARTGADTAAQAATRLPNPRGDMTHWLDSTNPSRPQTTYWTAMDALKNAINQHFFIGLFDLEAHFAIYPVGSIYQKHLDQFREKKERKISVILYLNENWQADNGGQLRLYLDEQDCLKYIDIDPEAGKLVAFLSDRFFHEVLPAARERTSLTGWFRTRSNHMP